MPRYDTTRARHREVLALELATQGVSWTQISEHLGYQDRSGAWKAAQRGLKKRSAAAADQYRSAALAELTMVQNAAWSRAMNGDVKAGTLVVRTVEQKCRLLGV